jgi:hypothetical protein
MIAIRNRHIRLMQQTCDTLVNVLGPVNQETATMLRDPNDGDKGWTVLKVLCHLRDFDGFFRGRAEMMRRAARPDLPAYDHEALAIERNYNGQDLREVLDALVASRQQTVEFFQGLSAAEWERTGVHPERGHFTMTDAVMQVGTHDVTHLEQITRILASAR